MKLNLKKLDCIDCNNKDVWFEESDRASCINCGSKNLIGNSYSFYINFSLEDGLYLIVTLHGENDNTSRPTEDRVYTLYFNGRRSGRVSQEIQDMAEKVLMEDFMKRHSNVLKDLMRSINKLIA